MTASAGAKARLRTLYPDLGPWSTAALWHGRCAYPVPTASPEPELQIIHQQRLAALLLRYVREAGVNLDGEITRFLQRSSMQWMSLTTAALQQADEVLSRLEAVGTRTAISKGPGVARWYPALDCRPYSDVDILVSPDRFRDAVTALEVVGWREEDRNIQPRNYMRWHCREGLNLRIPSGGSVDIHHRVPPWIWSIALNQEELIRRALPVEAAGRQLACLASADNALVAALHLVSDQNRPGLSLRAWRDLAEAVSHTPIDDLVTAAAEAQLAGWLRALLLALPEPCRPFAAIAALPDQPLPHPLRLNLLLSGRLNRLGLLATQTLRLPWPNAMLFTVGLAWPSRSFVRRKFKGDPHPYRRWFALARHRPMRAERDTELMSR